MSGLQTAPAPAPVHRLIPSQFPPIDLFDKVATADDLQAVMDLAGWTNDRLVVSRIERLPKAEWVYGVPNASIVMAAFLHVATAGMRFNGPELGAWYAGADLMTSVAEVAHHLRREAAARSLPGQMRRYREYTSIALGNYVDLRGTRHQMPDLFAPDSYVSSQAFGEGIRSSGGDGILFESVRMAGGMNVVGYRPTKITRVTQADHYEIEVSTGSTRIDVRKL